jgi:hypothetical protein
MIPSAMISRMRAAIRASTTENPAADEDTGSPFADFRSIGTSPGTRPQKATEETT